MSRNKGQIGHPPLLVVVGPTAVGKTSLSIKLASRLGGEIVSADSRLLYRGMDIGTDKPAFFDRSRIRHHLVDICLPDETISLGQYQQLAFQAINDIQRRGRLPLLVGGTGQYVRAIIEGWRIPEVPPHERLRDFLASLGGEELHRWLQYLDYEASKRIDPRNFRRMIRALEVALVTGRRITDLQTKEAPDYTIEILGLTSERQALYRLVDARVDEMMAAGLLDEVKRLRDAGYRRDLPSMSGLGYRQLRAYLESECTLEDAVERIKYETHRFVRQQYTWFRSDDPSITWFDVQEEYWEAAVEQHVLDWLVRSGYLRQPSPG